MPVRPILEIYVVWHPSAARVGRHASGAIARHFHTATFSGLAGGAIEVYMRSAGWARRTGPPRPLPITTEYPHGLPRAEFTAIVPVLGTWMARAVRDDPEWSRYVREIFDFHGRHGVGVYPLLDPDCELSGSALLELARDVKPLPDGCDRDATTLCRELAQAVTQSLDGSDGERERIQVFVSHTKHQSMEEQDEDGPWLADEVRKVISDTRLGHFFDASDLQSGESVESRIDGELRHGAVLAIRTDRYSGRAWTQHEVLVAKQGDLPIVTLHALRGGEDRGSFLMDHVPSVPCDLDNPAPAILKALNRIVDEALKRSLWRAQSVYIASGGFDWLPVHAPEPVTITRWLRAHRDTVRDDPHVWILHPDPPLGPRERDVIVELCALAGFTEDVDVLTPRTFAARGGRLR